jgi:hypothetical protein
MQTLVYINYLKGGQLHAGVNLGDGTIFSRPENPDSTNVDATIEIQLRDSVEKNLDSAHRVIDEGFAIIGSPQEAHLYHQETQTGRFIFMRRGTSPKNADEVKVAVADVFGLSNRYRSV